MLTKLSRFETHPPDRGGRPAAGVAIPSGCTFGVCGTCKVRKTAGEVHMVHNGGITEDEIEKVRRKKERQREKGELLQ